MGRGSYYLKARINFVVEELLIHLHKQEIVRTQLIFN